MTIRVSCNSMASWPLEYWEIDPVLLARYEGYRISLYKSVVHIQFELCYHANISIEDSDSMSHPELLLFHSELRKQKEAESEAVETAKSKRK